MDLGQGETFENILPGHNDFGGFFYNLICKRKAWAALSKIYLILQPACATLNAVRWNFNAFKP